MTTWPLPLRSLLVVSAGLGLFACSDDYVRVFVEGSSPELTATPVRIQIAAYGSGTGTSFGFSDTLARPDASGANVPSSDFAITFDDSAEGSLVVRAVVFAANTWGGDANVGLPGQGRDVHVALAAGERLVDSE